MTPELAQIIRDAIADDRIDLHTGLPGVIQDYDSEAKTATVVLALDSLVLDLNDVFVADSYPVLMNVPVWQYRTKKCFIYLPIEAGDTGFVHFAEGNMGQWLAEGEAGMPDENGRHTLTSGVFVPGLCVDSVCSDFTPPSEGLVLGYVDGGFVSVQEDGGIVAENADCSVSVKAGGEVEVLNGSGNFKLEASGVFSANSPNLTVDP